MNESIILIRDKDDSIKAHINNCRHRGARLLDEGIGSTKKITCPYHAWNYSTDGSLKAVPFKGKANIDLKKHCLHSLRVEIWNSLVFITFNKEIDSLSNRYSELQRYLDAYDIGRFKFAQQGEIESWNCNWKLAMENAMESYHLFAVHKDTLEKSTPTKKAYYIEGGPDWSITGGEIVDSKSKLSSLFSSSKDEYLYHYVLISLPPSFVGIFTYDSFSWIQILPTGVGKTKVYSCSTYEKSGKTPSYVSEFVKKFFKEDEAICERMQSSMKSQIAEGGKLVDLEKVVTDFRNYMGKRIFNSSVPAHSKDEKYSQIFP
jgi:phenylpropionate dioxygenase-like ring-hydroxylating dioxygenase large terminal subunit